MMQPPRGNVGCHPGCDGGAKISALCILPKAGQRSEGSFRRLGRGKIVDRRVGEARELRQREGQFLGHRLADIYRIAGQRLKGRFVSAERNLLLLVWGWAENERKAVGNRTSNRLQRDSAALLKLRLERRFQKDDLAAFSDELHFGNEMVESQQVETLRELFPLLRRGFDSLPERLETQPHQRNATGEFWRDVAHHDPPEEKEIACRSGGTSNRTRPARSSAADCRRNSLTMLRT